MKNRIFSSDNLVPPQTGTSLFYVCQNCGEHFSKKKGIFSFPVKCPKCGSRNCISPVNF